MMMRNWSILLSDFGVEVNLKPNIQLPISGAQVPICNLKVNSRGADVTALRKRLELLDYKISDRPAFFGVDARDAVIEFQRANSLPTTGVVNQATAAVLAKAATDATDDGANGRRIVRGRITEANGSPLFVTVSAFSIGLDGTTILGRSRSNKKGWYEINYVWVGTYAPDIGVAAGPDNREIARSATSYNVGTVLRIDLVRGNESLRGPGEYDRIDARVSARFKTGILMRSARTNCRTLSL
jgi:peptidoglycan hydrolase-like protein with peptidoglycan-binding domain